MLILLFYLEIIKKIFHFFKRKEKVMATKVSQVRQNFSTEVEQGINRQINMELYASYVYQSMAMYFDRDDVAMKGLSGYFKHNSDEEREHAEKLMTYMNKRGGRVVLRDVNKPENDEWGTALNALQNALDLEKKVNQSLLDLHVLSSSMNDTQFCEYLESEFLDEQIESIKQIGDLITKLKRAGPGLGEYIFDKDIKP